ncbi:MAG: hypothetical protein IPL84_05425 [Chitinophagaceae bacterium]|nr:hypothetical protein [Chitinophagaceae bacterium]
MVVNKRILVLPHIGTAFGHLIRLSEFINETYDSSFDISLVIPAHSLKFCKGHIPVFVKLIIQKEAFSINGNKGNLDVKSCLKLIQELAVICDEIKPNLIIGDPGIQAAILGNMFGIQWKGIMHGCYLPKPIVDSKNNNGQLHALVELAWEVSNHSMNKLVKIGTNGKFKSWEEIRKTGQIIIPNNSAFEPSPIGLHIEQSFKRIGWETGSPVELLITCCSEGNIQPTVPFLTKISRTFTEVTVAGITLKDKIGNINFIGNNIAYETLISNKTIVITHCGHGTLKSIKKAKRVFMIPGDIDQLCNSLIAHVYHGWDLVFDKNWFEILESKTPFKREINWNNIHLAMRKDELIIRGLPIMQIANVDYYQPEHI